MSKKKDEIAGLDSELARTLKVAGEGRTSVRPGVEPTCGTASRDRQVVEHVSKAPCSFELSRNAKGEPSWSIKAYAEREGLRGAIREVLAHDEYVRAQVRGEGGEGRRETDGGSDGEDA